MKDGRPILYKQCECGFVYPGMVSYKNDKTIVIENIVLIDRELEVSRKNQTYKEINDFREQFEYNKSISIINPSDAYYLSNEWEIRRKLVLNRDKYICQSCLSNKATQVHHLTYKHFKNEPLFDLISICEFCHLQVTKMDRKDKSFEVIKFNCL